MTPQHLFKLPVELVVETAQYLARWASSSVVGPGGPGGPLSPHQTGQREHRPTYCTKRTRQWKEYRHLVDSDGDNLLHRAVKRSRPIADIAFLLDEELDINHRNGQGRTPLAVAIAIKNSARIKKPDIVELLLQREQRPTFQTTGPDILCIERLSTRKHGLNDCWRNMTPTSRLGLLTVKDHFIWPGASTRNVSSSKHCWTLGRTWMYLQVTRSGGRFSNTPICGGDNNSTALTWAVRGGKLEAVRLLLGYRAKKQLELSGKDAFYWVVHDGREPIRCPLDGADVHQKAYLGRSARSLAADQEHVESSNAVVLGNANGLERRLKSWLYAGSFVCHRTTRKRVKEPEMTQLVDHLTPGLVVDFPLLRRARHERQRETWELGVAQALFQPAVFG
ncbi:hypothetical protein KXW21_006212 [Aspergillus fumigatus]|nr:hypothetical protein KXX49_006399 [Aspergillus fumigatus]KAH2065507.1 hypothetical protein KXW21_006212 [Aspergillus fumigatus]